MFDTEQQIFFSVFYIFYIFQDRPMIGPRSIYEMC